MPSSRQSRGTFRTALALGVAGLVGLPAWIALGQPAASPLFVDDSPLASDGLIRAGELASVGNLDESVTVLQGLLDGEADRLLASPGEPDLFTPVRGRVHAALQANPRLLERYRELQEPAAAALLGSSDPAALERSRLLDRKSVV